MSLEIRIKMQQKEIEHLKANNELLNAKWKAQGSMIQNLHKEIKELKHDNDNVYDILAKVRDILLPLVNPLNNQCGDMLACTVSNPECIECLAKQISKQFSQIQNEL